MVFSGDAVCEYESEGAFDEGLASSMISLGMDDDYWVIEDNEGNIFYEHDELQLGWRSEYEAQRQARYLRSRESGPYSVRLQQDVLSKH